MQSENKQLHKLHTKRITGAFLVGYFQTLPTMQQLKEQYRTWLKTLGFAESSVNNFSGYVSEMLHCFEANNITEADQITGESVEAFFFQWRNRKNKTRGGGLSMSHVRSGATAINNFIKFLKATGKNSLEVKLEREQVKTKTPEVLTLKEINQIYQATFHLDKRNNNEAYGQRDRAMLAVFYGCGLRRNEGSSLETSDIIREKKLILVRQGKGSKERLVPITENGLQDITEYIDYGRDYFLKQNKARTDALFVNIHGESMKSFTMRLKALKELAGINKNMSLHTFRHSIATHLLQAGMDIEEIRKFLGHASLESTQIYTHITNEQL